MHKKLVGGREGKRPLGISIRRWKIILKCIVNGIQQKGCVLGSSGSELSESAGSCEGSNRV
jgi:hypothetical protein